MMTTLRRLLIAFFLLLGASPALAAGTYTDAPQLRTNALAALFAKVGDTRPINRVTLRPDEIIVAAQPDSGPDLAEWTVHRIDLKLLTLHTVSGPRTAYDNGIVDDVRQSFFARTDIDLESVDAVVAAAVAYAKLNDIPTVDYVEIARDISILPEPSYGDIRWTIRLKTDRESATVYADNRGKVIGGDLSDTERARHLDLLQSDDWPMADAQALLAQAIGPSRVHTVRLYDSYIFVTADHPTDTGLQRDYSWNLEGVTRGLVDTPNLVTLGMGGIATFDFRDIDLTKLPAIKAAAIAAFDSPGAVITGIEAEQPTDRASTGPLQILWEVELRQSNGETGKVLLDAGAGVVEVQLPDSRTPAIGPWLAPATVVNTLQRIEKAFGPDAKIFSILIDDERASIDIEDPQAPGQLAQFIIDPRDIQRFGTASFFADLAPEHVFTMKDLAPLTEERLAEFADRTLKRMNRDDYEVFRFTISRQALIMDQSDNRLMVEVRAGKDQGNEGGWMTFLLDGTQTDELLP